MMQLEEENELLDRMKNKHGGNDPSKWWYRPRRKELIVSNFYRKGEFKGSNRCKEIILSDQSGPLGSIKYALAFFKHLEDMGADQVGGINARVETEKERVSSNFLSKSLISLFEKPWYEFVSKCATVESNHPITTDDNNFHRIHFPGVKN